MFYVFMKFVLCHDLYIITISFFQYLMKFVYKSNVLCHHEIKKSEFYVIIYM